MHTSSRVAIIGAGVSGLAAAKHLARHHPQVFEASDSIGGVWRKCTYETTKLQSVRVSYELSDFLWPNRGESSFPTYVDVLDYLEAYAKHFNLVKFIKFNSKVVELRFIGDGKTLQMGDLGAYGNLLPGKPVWEVAVNTGDGDIQWHAFEYVVVCAGKYGDVPRTPTFPVKKGPEIFKGKVLHSMDYSKLQKEKASQLLHGKKVAVIGFKKSAIDLALESALANQEKYGLKPDHAFEEDYASCQMALVPEKFFEEADKGMIRFKRTTNWWFYDEGIEFEDGTTLEADVVILATGYDGMKKLKAIVPEPFRSWLEFPWGIMPLYRGTIHPLIPNMGFIGYVQSSSNLKSSELHLRWLSQLLDGKFTLPSKEKMLDQFLKEMHVMRRSSRFYKNHCFSTFSIQHADDLSKDMNLKP
ncbi:FAD/NAD(P)-binding domain superfamily [Arabidopsis suecica]|uniref:Flavin-containing monooxygenase n=1 Tax=Arabidopsis suecica TaxID=45249 RepID=A0A8T2DXE8_ARASU|nr:FAD/NAD(P)-binding domain superfamily [Arabidopsis suecica]